MTETYSNLVHYKRKRMVRTYCKLLYQGRTTSHRRNVTCPECLSVIQELQGPRRNLVGDSIEWDLDANLPMYTRDFFKYREELVLGFKIGDQLYSPEEVKIVMNFGQMEKADG